MLSVRLQELLDDPATWLQRVAEGETLVVTTNGTPLATITPAEPASGKPRPIGLAAGEFVVPEGFDDPLPEDVLAQFEGR